MFNVSWKSYTTPTFFLWTHPFKELAEFHLRGLYYAPAEGTSRIALARIILENFLKTRRTLLKYLTQDYRALKIVNFVRFPKIFQF